MKITTFCLLLAVSLVACQTPLATTVDATTPVDPIARFERERVVVVEVIASVERTRRAGEPVVRWIDGFFPRISSLPGAPDTMVSQNLGAGVVINSDGFVLANAHVVANANEVTVGVAGQTPYSAHVVGVDVSTDIALLKIDAGELPAARLGRSRELKPGEWVAAIGTPEGFPDNISTGVVSGKARALDDSLIPLIQADVASNHPVSSGALVNRNGEVVGINSGVIARSAKRGNAALAIPIEVALEVARQLYAHGKVERADLGMRIEEITPAPAYAFESSPRDGVVVSAVARGGPAERAGVAVGDVILRVNNAHIRSALDLSSSAVSMKPGTSVRLRLWRHGIVKDVTAIAFDTASYRL